MNVGYMNVGMSNDVSCPICGSNVYINKYGSDYRCMNTDCFLNKKASESIKEIQSVLNREAEE